MTVITQYGIGILRNRMDALQQEMKNVMIEMKEVMTNATVVDVTTIQTETVTVGSVVTLVNIDTDQKVVYRLVGSVESDPSKGMISYTSPVGKEMMGLRVDDAFEINIGPNTIEYEIASIESKPL